MLGGGGRVGWVVFSGAEVGHAAVVEEEGSRWISGPGEWDGACFARDS